MRLDGIFWRRVRFYTALAAVAGLYVLLFTVLRGVTPPEERRFPPRPGAAGQPLEVYVDPITVDPIREESEMRIYYNSSGYNWSEASRIDEPSPADLRIFISDGGSEQEIHFKPGDILATTTFRAELTGDFNSYPFDRYHTKLLIQAFKGERNTEVPLDLTVWEGVAAWAVRVDASERRLRRNEVELNFDIRRPRPLVFFAFIIYAIMIMIAVAAVVIGGMVFTGRRKIEATLVSALAGMTFALPAVRTIMPSAPPIGVRADVIVLLWTELAVAFGLGCFVYAWARRGPAP